MTKKRYRKLMRALMTYLHEYSKLTEGEINPYSGKPYERTSMKREHISTHPNWDMVSSYEEAWQKLQPLWESVQENVELKRAERTKF